MTPSPPRGGALTKAARAEFGRHGFAGATVQAIALAASLRKASLFANFKTESQL